MFFFLLNFSSLPTFGCSFNFTEFGVFFFSPFEQTFYSAFNTDNPCNGLSEFLRGRYSIVFPPSCLLLLIPLDITVARGRYIEAITDVLRVFFFFYFNFAEYNIANLSAQ